jgi:hypothetical protein
VREGIKNVLCSPAFLYLGSESPQVVAAEPKRGRVHSQSMDGRWRAALSYLLWSSMPDHALYSLAAQDALKNPAVLRAPGAADDCRSQG